MADGKDFKKAVELVNESENILITTHTRPDGDACGSMVGIAEALLAIGKNVKLLLLSELPQWYAFMYEEQPAVLGVDVTVEQLKAGKFYNPDLIIIVDTNSHNQLEAFDEYLKQNKKPVLVIDHHVTSDHLGDIELEDTTAAAAGLVVFDLLKYAKWPINKRAAEALFVAISTDTGWFRFSNVDSRVHRSSAELLELGVDSPRIYHVMYQNFSLARFKLMVAMLSTLELHNNGKFAVQQLFLRDFEEVGATFKDTENLIDECQRINSVEAAAFFVEQTDGRIKCSLRSKGSIDVRKIAQKFGGGGHVMAAGLHLPGPMENAKRLIYNEVIEQFEEIDRRKKQPEIGQ